jgi:hypothetical protein
VGDFCGILIGSGCRHLKYLITFFKYCPQNAISHKTTTTIQTLITAIISLFPSPVLKNSEGRSLLHLFKARFPLHPLLLPCFYLSFNFFRSAFIFICVILKSEEFLPLLSPLAPSFSFSFTPHEEREKNPILECNLQYHSALFHYSRCWCYCGFHH